MERTQAPAREDGELWTPDGELIAQSRRRALMRELE
jgi:hypothetical protein